MHKPSITLQNEVKKLHCQFEKLISQPTAKYTAYEMLDTYIACIMLLQKLHILVSLRHKCIISFTLNLSVPALANSTDLLHINMPTVMRGLTFSVPGLANSIDLLHIYMPVVMRGLTLSVPGIANIRLTTHLHAYGHERVNPLSTRP